MHRRLIAAALCAICSLAAARTASAQQLDLPRPSPNARVSQTLGYTEITVEYSSPAVKGRTIFGGLLPWDKLWRTGANVATKVTFSKDVTVADKAVPAGTYSLFTIPGQAAWTVILNKNASASTDEYKAEQDALRFSATPKVVPARERLAFLFSDFGEGGGNLDIEWATTRVSLPIKVNTEAQVQAALTGFTNSAWRPWNSGARYLLENKAGSKGELDRAMQFVDRSLAIKEEWFNTWTKAQLLFARGDKKAAHQWAEKAKALGDKSDGFFFKDEVTKAVADWKK